MESSKQTECSVDTENTAEKSKAGKKRVKEDCEDGVLDKEGRGYFSCTILSKVQGVLQESGWDENKEKVCETTSSRQDMGIPKSHELTASADAQIGFAQNPSVTGLSWVEGFMGPTHHSGTQIQRE